MPRFRRTTLITVGSLSVLVGVGLSRLINIDLHPAQLTALVIPILLLRNTYGRLVVVVLVCLSVGFWRGEVYVQRLNQLKQLTGYSQTYKMVAKSDAVYGKSQQLEFTATGAMIASSHKAVVGSFKISGFGPTMVYRGDTIQVTGRLYITRGSNQAGISFARIEVVGQDSSLINKLTRKFAAGMQNALPEPLASFALGLLIGQKSTMPQNILSELTLVGLAHVVAVSGYNLTILVRAAGRIKLGSKYQKLILSLGLIAAFVLMTGFSASIVRAALVSTLSLWAWFYGRKIKPLLLILFTAAITSFWNPFYVWSDTGWYLSFLAFFGILIISPIIISRFFRRRPKLIGLVLIETLCAEIMTLPLIMATFGQMSLVALLANILIVPLVPLAMLLSSVAMISGAWLPAIAGWFAWPAKEVLMYMLDLVHILASLKFSQLQLSVDWLGMTLIYIIIATIFLGIWKSSRRKNIGSTP